MNAYNRVFSHSPLELMQLRDETDSTDQLKHSKYWDSNRDKILGRKKNFNSDYGYGSNYTDDEDDNEDDAEENDDGTTADNNDDDTEQQQEDDDENNYDYQTADADDNNDDTAADENDDNKVDEENELTDDDKEEQDDENTNEEVDEALKHSEKKLRKWSNIRDKIQQHRADIKQWKENEQEDNLTPMQRHRRAR